MAGWIDQPRPKNHHCPLPDLNEIKMATKRQDLPTILYEGRRWQCDCLKVWSLYEVPDAGQMDPAYWTWKKMD